MDAPDEIQHLLIDRRTLARGHYTSQGFEKRQVMDIEVLRWVTEYQAEVLVDEHGQRFVAELPAGVTRQQQSWRARSSHGESAAEDLRLFSLV